MLTIVQLVRSLITDNLFAFKKTNKFAKKMQVFVKP